MVVSYRICASLLAFLYSGLLFASRAELLLYHPKLSVCAAFADPLVCSSNLSQQPKTHHAIPKTNNTFRDHLLELLIYDHFGIIHEIFIYLINNILPIISTLHLKFWRKSVVLILLLRNKCHSIVRKTTLHHCFSSY